MFSIAIADDLVLFRKSFRHFVENVCKVDVCMEASDGHDLLVQLQDSVVHPDIILTDVQMPGMNGRELTLVVTKMYPKIKVIALSVLHHEDTVLDMLHCGAKGFITKNIEPGSLITAFNTVMSNQYFLFDGIKETIFCSLQTFSFNKAGHHLTEKQVYFLQLCATDLPYKSIADKMHISPRTADIYRDNLFLKLNIKSRSGLVLYAVQNGFIEL